MASKSAWKSGLLAAALVVGVAGVASAYADEPTKVVDQEKMKEKMKEKAKETKDKAHEKGEQMKEQAREKAKEMKDKAKVAIGAAAPAISLKDTEGNSVNLADLTKDGNIVVLQWFNPGCPFVKKHYENGANTFNDMAKKYEGKKVKFLAINSGAPGKEGYGQELNARMKAEWKINYPVLLDESGTVGKAFGAKRTPEMFVVKPDGTLAYHGAIDDNDRAKGQGKVNYVEKAVDALLEGKSVETNSTKAYGCSVKYAE